MTARTVIKYAIWVIIIGFIIALFIYSAVKPKESTHIGSQPWNDAMVLGDPDAPNKIVEYTDYFCSFCADFSKAMDEDFKKKYIDTGKVSVENRIIDLLKEQSVNTPIGNRAAFCAADQNKYWEYSKKIVIAIDTDFFQKGIGVKNVARPVKIQPLEDDYFIQPAKEVGLDTTSFASCLKSSGHDEEIRINSNKAINMGVTGLPHITVNDYTARGFAGGAAELEMILKAGGVPIE